MRRPYSSLALCLALVFSFGMLLAACKDPASPPAPAVKGVSITGSRTALVGVPWTLHASLNFTIEAPYHYYWIFSDTTIITDIPQLTRTQSTVGVKRFRLQLIADNTTTVITETSDSIEVIGRTIRFDFDTQTVRISSPKSLRVQLSADLITPSYRLYWKIFRNGAIVRYDSGRATNSHTFTFDTAGLYRLSVEYYDALPKVIAQTSAFIKVIDMTQPLTIHASKEILDPWDSAMFSVESPQSGITYKWLLPDSLIRTSTLEPVTGFFAHPGRSTVRVASYNGAGELQGRGEITITVNGVPPVTLEDLHSMLHVYSSFDGEYLLPDRCYQASSIGFDYANPNDSIHWTGAHFQISSVLQYSDSHRTSSGSESSSSDDIMYLSGDITDSLLSMSGVHNVSQSHDLEDMGRSIINHSSAGSNLDAHGLHCIAHTANSITFGLYGREVKPNVTRINAQNSESGNHNFRWCSGKLTGPNWESTTKPPILKVVFTK